MARREKPAGATPAEKPKKQRFARTRQLKQVYDMTVRVDPGAKWVLLLALVGPIVLGLVIGLLVDHPIYFTILGVLVGVLAAMFVLGRRAERAAYVNLEGQKGAAGAALSSIRRGWTVEQEPVAAEARSQDMVFRAIGRGGIVLVGDGPPQRVKKLLEAERRKTARIAPNVPVHLFTVGDGGGENEVPLRKIASRVQRLKPQLTKQEVAAVHKRLKALGGIRPPVPKGIDPMRARPDRKAMRGR
jgi:F0F1-type ATP synthase assembly protein I